VSSPPSHEARREHGIEQILRRPITKVAGVAISVELLAFAAIVLLAAALRFVDLPTRGTWDADQGHDMLVLRDFVEGRAIPLLGPPTSIGDFHHGVLYYLILAPAALLSASDPLAVTAWIALGGVAAVAVTGWLGRAIGGSVAGLISALLLATSASAVEESVFIWNPNVIALSSAVALAAAWQAWRTRRPGWWVAAGVAAVVTMHAHVLGVILTPVVAGLLVADARRRRAPGSHATSAIRATSGVRRAALVWAGLLALSYVPLLVHELGSGGSELRAAVAFLTGGEGGGSAALPSRLSIVAIRVLSWPLAGLITAAPVVAFGSAVLVVALGVWRGWLASRPRLRSGNPANDMPLPEETVGMRWLTLGLAWSVLALALAASSLATVVPGLPNDHYHAFADPIVVVIVGVGVAGLIRSAGRASPAEGRRVGAAAASRGASAAIAGVILVGLVGWNLEHQPAARVADGGWPAADEAALRVIGTTGDGPLVLASVPAFKSDEALRFPLARRGLAIAPRGATASDATSLVVLCDQLFVSVTGASCGGPAEDALVTGSGGATMSAVDRFEAAPGRWMSIYRR
jgi:hypothetical protein